MKIMADGLPVDIQGSELESMRVAYREVVPCEECDKKKNAEAFEAKRKADNAAMYPKPS